LYAQKYIPLAYLNARILSKVFQCATLNVDILSVKKITYVDE
jgi:hypothetical protein